MKVAATSGPGLRQQPRDADKSSQAIQPTRERTMPDGNQQSPPAGEGANGARDRKAGIWVYPGFLLAVPSIRTAAIGYVRGEPFYQNAPSSSWVKRLKDQHPDARQEAAAELRGGGARAVPVLVAVLGFGDPRDSSFVDGRLSEHGA